MTDRPASTPLVATLVDAFPRVVPANDGPRLLNLVREAWPRIERMGHDAIAECHAAGVPAWVSEAGWIWRLDPDGTRHVETLTADEVIGAAAARICRSP